MTMKLEVSEHDPLGAAALGAVRTGDIEALERLVGEHAGLAAATMTRPACGGKRRYSYPLIGAATDWPGHFPRVAETIALLAEAGAEVNARAHGAHEETPLHGAASSDDVEALDALLDAGADVDAPGGVIAGGTPLDDAVGFGQWRAARRLVERGARTAVWHAAALGLMDRVEAHFEAGRPPARHPWGAAGEDVDVAFWCACHGGQRRAAEYLLGRGAELHWRAPWDGLTPTDAARRSGAEDLATWLRSLGGT